MHFNPQSASALDTVLMHCFHTKRKVFQEQERNVSDLLGPPRDVVDVVDVPDLDLNYEVRDEELCNMPMPSEVFHIEMSKSVFHNCTFNFATK